VLHRGRRTDGDIDGGDARRGVILPCADLALIGSWGEERCATTRGCCTEEGIAGVQSVPGGINWKRVARDTSLSYQIERGACGLWDARRKARKTSG
jgi:hypothetical protein